MAAAKKEVEFINYTFVDKFGTPIYAARIGATSTKLKNLVDEFKYAMDLKVLTVSHCPQFITYVKEKGIKVEKGTTMLDWW